MNEGDRLKRILVLCLVILMMAGCAKEEKTVNRAVFAWEGVEEADEQLLENYRIDTIFMDINHYSSIPGYNIYLLSGDPSWGLEDGEHVVEIAEEKRADGVLFDIKGNYVRDQKKKKKPHPSLPPTSPLSLLRKQQPKMLSFPISLRWKKT